MNNKFKFKINIFGLGYVGLTLAAKLLEKGFLVNGFEISDKILDHLLIKKKAHFIEPGINKIIRKAILKKKFIIKKKLENKINERTINVITIGTPIINEKIYLGSIYNVCKEINSNLQNEKSIIILRSTVKVGTTRKLKKKFKKKIYFSFCPERTIEGAAIKELSVNPQIIASEDNYTKKNVKKFFNLFNKNIIEVNKFEKSELLKLFDNTYRDINFSIGNEFGRISNKLGLSGEEIIKLCNKNYSRTNIPLPGLVGGPCLEKDPYILLESTNLKKDNIIYASRKLNENMMKNGLYEICKLIDIKKITKICIVGLAFKGKPKTNDLRGSLAIPMIKNLYKKNRKLKIYGLDINVNNQDIKNLGINIFDKKIKYDLFIIQNNAIFIKKIGFSNFIKKLNKKGLLYDYWNHFKNNHKNYINYA